jgi:hypothetical protein
MDLEKLMSAVQLHLTPINSRRQVLQVKYLAGVSLHPQEGSELRDPSQTRICLSLADFK